MYVLAEEIFLSEDAWLGTLPSTGCCLKKADTAYQHRYKQVSRHPSTAIL
jgi:hypothetical protein